MGETKLQELSDRLEAALTIDEALAGAALGEINRIAAGEAGAFSSPDLDSTDRILELIYAMLPGWTVSVKGKAWQPNGHWTCSLRKTSSRDSDEYIGIGRGPTLPHSLLAALLRVVAQREG